MAQVSIRNVTKIYPDSDNVAVDNVSLEIADGEFTVLVGPSGCGKSTLLRMVAGLETLSSGGIYLGDRQVDGLEPAERDVAMVFQNYALYPHMTTRANMAYGLKNRKFAKEEIAKRVEKAARILQLEPLLDRKPRHLSGGQRQRVAMGRAIVREPACFLFDEPLSNLDAKLRVDMRAEIKTLQRTLDTTALYVTHDQVEAMTLADRVVVLNNGRIEQVGSPLEIYKRPNSTFVAAFIGSPAMNLIPIEVLKRAIDTSSETAVVPDGAVSFGVRPEDVSFQPHEGAIELSDMAVTLVEELGAGRLVHLKLGASKIVASTSTDATFADCTNIYLGPESLHFFASDGFRI